MEGCLCREGTLLLGNSCVTPDQCGCVAPETQQRFAVRLEFSLNTDKLALNLLNSRNPGEHPGSPIGGGGNPRGGANIWFYQNFWKTAWNWEKFGPPPLDPSLKYETTEVWIGVNAKILSVTYDLGVNSLYVCLLHKRSPYCVLLIIYAFRRPIHCIHRKSLRENSIFFIFHTITSSPHWRSIWVKTFSDICIILFQEAIDIFDNTILIHTTYCRIDTHVKLY